MFQVLVAKAVPTAVCPSWKAAVLQLSEASTYTETSMLTNEIVCEVRYREQATIN